ncbi:MAG: DUF2894 domain-containing protein [Lysobacteraceae bacterium]|nr:MAG: DUF2894 domain-containing protein [Xanthomonadaceae bacterium]
MHPEAPVPHAVLEAWREQRADRFDPLAFHRMDALQRRLGAHRGEVRRMLEARLSAQIDAYAAALETGGSCLRPPAKARVTRSALAELVDDLTRLADVRNAGSAGPASGAPFPEMEALDHFRRTWSRSRTERQVRDSLASSPTDAGPLNSASLVKRSLDLMRTLSPGYLHHFVSYVDVLSSLERMEDSGVLKPATGRGTRPGNSPGAGRAARKARKPRR